MELELAVLRPPLPHALVLQVVHVLRAGPGRVLLIAAARVTALSKTHAPEGRGLGAARVAGQPTLGLVVEILGTGAHKLSLWRDRGNIGLGSCYEE